MKAGRELDALVAEKVMGIEPYRAKLLDWEGRYIRKGVPLTDWHKTQSIGEWEYCGPDYSTNISHAWLVVEKFRDINVLNTAVKFQKIMQMQTQGNIFHVNPLIICLSALTAVGVDVE